MCGGDVVETQREFKACCDPPVPISLTSEEVRKCLQTLEVYVEKHWQTLEVQTSKFANVIPLL